MGRVNTPAVSEQERAALEKGLRKGKSHAFRMRCQAILLKAEGRNSKDVATIVGMCHVSVNSWLKRYKDAGMAGLVTKPGRGRKPLLDKGVDGQAVIEAVKANRSRIAMAKAQWEATRSEASKPVGRQAFTSFLKALAQDISGFEKE